MERYEKLSHMMEEKVPSVAEEHPVAVTVGLGALGLVASVPLCALAYRFVGRQAGKAAAKELIDAGVWLGYTHP